jgi:hypothetical protein
MRKHAFYFIFAWLILVLACKKTDHFAQQQPLDVLARELSKTDFARLDLSTVKELNNNSGGGRIIRAGFSGNSGYDFVLLRLDEKDEVIFSKIITLSGQIEPSVSNKCKFVFNGTITTRSPKTGETFSSLIKDGFILSLHIASIRVSSGSVRTNSDCTDCTIPEVVVSSSPKKIGDPFAWLNLFWLDDSWPKMEYLPVGGGGGGDPTILDTEEAENKKQIDPKKYTDCFDHIPDGPTTIYSLTIAADLPADGRPDVFFDWSDRFPGHAFIELNKSTPAGSVAQRIGFYPNTSFKVLTGNYIESKIIDDGGHEYQASYTITVSAADFRAAVAQLNSASTKPYQVSFYNCTDFALQVFNAAGGNLTIPRHAIPGFEVDGGSNTPQGLYEKIDQLKNNGTAGAHTTRNKEYTGDSKGPCD